MPEPGDADEEQRDGGVPPSRRLTPLRAAQLRTRVVRGGLVRVALATVFLVGALAHALSPQRHERSATSWMTALILSSTVNLALGLRAISRARRRRWARFGPAWIHATIAWAVLALTLIALLLHR